MRILHFTRTMDTGGTEKIILQLCETFNNSGNSIMVCSSGGKYENKLDKMGIRHKKIRDIESKNPIVILINFIQLYKLIRKYKPDIIHTHHRMAAFYIKCLRILGLNIRHIHTAHNVFHNKRGLTRFSLGKVQIVSVGLNVKRNLVEYFGLQESMIHNIYNSVVSENVDKEPKISKKSNEFIVTNVGRLSEQKGMEYFIDAAKAIINQNYTNFRFLIVGDGELYAKLEQKIKNNGLMEYVILLGYRNDVQNIISQSNLVVLSSLWEGLPLTPIETFAQGKTIVATSIDGTPEIVEDEKNGLLVPAKNVEALAQAILKIYNNKSLKSNLEEMARESYINNFSYSSFQEKYIKLYEKVGR